MGANYYKDGDYNVIADCCGFKVKASTTRKQWNGLRVCIRHWEAQHPQDFLRGKRDDQSVPDPRPDSAPIFNYPSGILLDNTGMPVLDSDDQWILTSANQNPILNTIPDGALLDSTSLPVLDSNNQYIIGA